VSERVVYINGEFVPESRATISVFDRGFVSGDGVYDVARSFGQRPHKLHAHCERLMRSLQYTRIRLDMSAAEVEGVIREVFDRNKGLLAPGDDYIIWIIVTRGREVPSRNPLDAGRATIVVYTIPPHYQRFAKFYRVGAHVVLTATRRTPPECLDPKAKITNKMNHIQAEFEAKLVDPEAFPLLLDMEGNIAESSNSNFFFIRQGRVLTPRPKAILLGIMRECVFEIAPSATVEIAEGDFTPYDIYTADEAFLTTTSFSILPVSRINGRALPCTIPGPVTSRLIRAWNQSVGIDVVEQALSHVPEAERVGMGGSLAGD
jgi:branched-chain amino acid aminotransferase